MAFVDFKSTLHNSDLGKCRGISTARRKSSRYLARRHAKAGLQLEEVMMARTRIIQSYTQINFALSAAHQQICSCPAATASRRRGNDLRTTIKYLGNNERRRGHWPRRTRIIHRCTQVKFAIFRCTSAAFLCTQESWNPEVINTFFARARIGGSRDDAHPDSCKASHG
jgi:hypothetical protein